MSERTVYEYAVVRAVPRVEREEFINVGVALFCRKQRYACLKFHIDEAKLRMLYQDVDIDSLKAHLLSFQRICNGDKTAGKIANLEQDERFRWLTANRSTIIQSSPTHIGMCFSAEEIHEELFNKLIL
ncbi:DUF3037 domain-containing protein [Sphingobacterium rhinopitheci]|uniref:DUF3037 domain-containing protein n=1 Tax=Sphingobacterium rhinopitheci TaxID=2781960 RepID=UPI001F51A6C3|nr:DUF3037 domain-containing protein [Sphingobacterium rhinopitheci]MCI0920282.1 DUF3037 domain-containing protein [Sphingobacterium rhinopitheci]